MTDALSLSGQVIAENTLKGLFKLEKAFLDRFYFIGRRLLLDPIQA